MYDFFVSLLNPLMWGEAWVMNAWHSLFTLIGIPYESGWGWALSIVGLTVVVRANPAAAEASTAELAAELDRALDTVVRRLGSPVVVSS